jgi:cytochrome c biogenesis protein CcdA
MLRSFAEVIVLFAAPFLVYFCICVYCGHPLNPFDIHHRQHLKKLILAGLVTSIIGILLLGFLEPHKMGAFQPAVFKNGKLIESTIAPEPKR